MGVDQPFQILSIFDFMFVPPADLKEILLNVFLVPLDVVERIEFLVVGDDFLQKPADPLPVLLLLVDISVVLQQLPKSLVVEYIFDHNGLPVVPPELVLEDSGEGDEVVLLFAGESDGTILHHIYI